VQDYASRQLPATVKFIGAVLDAGQTCAIGRRHDNRDCNT
jgi:hypothetical protein